MLYWLLSRSCFYCPNLITVIFLQLEMKRFVKVMWFWGNDVTTTRRRIQNGTLWMRFTFCPNLMFLTSPRLEIYRFSRFSSLSNSKLIFNLLLWASQNWPYTFIFTNFGQVTVILMSLCKRLGSKKQSYSLENKLSYMILVFIDI